MQVSLTVSCGLRLPPTSVAAACQLSATKDSLLQPMRALLLRLLLPLLLMLLQPLLWPPIANAHPLVKEHVWSIRRRLA